jgi:intraflagellar transport protein 57
MDAGDDMDDDDRYEGDADVADMLPGGKNLDNDGENSEEIDDDMEFGNKGGHGDEVDVDRQQIIQSNIGREEWMLEVERVGHRLKINKAGADGKEWRSHMDQTKKFHDAVKQSLPEVRGKLERLSDDVSKALEKIAKKESVLTRSF